MFVLIAGGGQTPAQLATLLVAQKHQVHLIENRPDLLSLLHGELPTEVIYEGNATDPAMLERAGIQQANILAACLRVDAENLALCFLARTRYGVPRTIARIINPRNAWLYDQKFHVDVALNQAGILSSLIEEEMSLGDMMTLLKIRRGRYSLVEEKIPTGAPAEGVAIKDVALPPNSVIAAIIRGGQMVIPRGTIRFEAGDEVLAIVDPAAAKELAILFGRPQTQPPESSP